MKKPYYLCCFILITLWSPITHGNTGKPWNTLETTHFRTYYQSHAKSAQEVADIAENFYSQLGRLMNGMVIDKIEIWICDTEAQFQSAVHAPIHDWAIGCAFPLSRRIVIQNPRVIIERKFQLSQIVRHEIVHVVFGQRTQKIMEAIPLWFVEGIAMYLSDEWAPHHHDLLLKHIFSNSIISLTDLVAEFPRSETHAQLAYAESLNAVAWLVELGGIDKLWEIIARLEGGEDLNTAYEQTIGWNLITFDTEWRASLPQRYHRAAIFANPYILWGVITTVFVLIFLYRRQQLRKRLVELNRQESQIDPFFRSDGTPAKD
jgi:hypothetical protein